MRKLLKVKVFGSVQGVGYRHFVRMNAESLNLSGNIRNLPDGSVEAVFVGQEEDLKKMLEICRKGSAFSKITKVVEEWSNPDESFNGFKVLSS
ncbi:MAG: acylphosphatase [Candidatus Woesearchaeota archaeon]